MKTKKIAALLLAAITMVGTMPMTASAADDSVYTIKITTNNNPTVNLGNYQALDFIYSGALAFENYCEAQSNGRIQVEVYHSGQLGSTVEALQQCMQGTIQACMAGDGETSTLYPNIQALSVPYLFNDRTEFYSMLDSEFMQGMYTDIENTLGIKTLASADNGGFRNFSNSQHPIKSAADMKGLKIRCMEIPAHSIMLESMGAIACPMAWNELYTALQTGVVDGQENSPGTTLNGGFYEVNKYYTMDNHSISSIYLYFNTDYFNTLPEDLQKIVTEAGVMAQHALRGGNCANETLAIEQLASKGMEIYYPTEEEKATFKDAAQEPVVEWLRGEVGDEFVEEFMTAVAKSNAGETTGASATMNTEAAAASGGTSTMTYVAFGIAGVAVLIAVFTVVKSRKKEEEE